MPPTHDAPEDFTEEESEELAQVLGMLNTQDQDFFSTPAHQELTVLGPDIPTEEEDAAEEEDASYDPLTWQAALAMPHQCIRTSLNGVEIWLDPLNLPGTDTFHDTPIEARCREILSLVRAPIERLEVHPTYIVVLFARDWLLPSVVVPVTTETEMTVWDHLTGETHESADNT